MKTKLLFTTMLLSAFIANAQLAEDFNGATFPPTGWTTFVGTNGEGDTAHKNWTRYSNSIAMCRPDDSVTAGATSEDWMVTHQFMVDATTPTLAFAMCDFSSSVTNSVYTVRVSTASQTTHSDFTILYTQTEADLTPFNLNPDHHVDLSSYVGQNVYVAFVLEQNDGDYALIDDVSMIAGTAAVENVRLASEVTVYPTLAIDFFTIKNEGNTPLSNVSIIDALGRVVLSQDLNDLLGSKKIDLINLNPGQYFVKIDTDNFKGLTKRIIIK